MILRKFWTSSENSEDPQKIPRMRILKILRIVRKFWRWRSSEKSEDDDPQKILRILRKVWGWGSSENSEDPRKILRMTSEILRKFWGWGSSNKSDDRSRKPEGSSEKLEGFSVNLEESPELFDNRQKVLIYNENMSIKDQFFVARHQLQSPRVFCTQKNTANIFSANCDSFLRISPASHHNFLRRNYHQKFVGIIWPVWGYPQNGRIKISAEIYHDTSHKLCGYHQDFLIPAQRISIVSQDVNWYHITKVFGG